MEALVAIKLVGTKFSSVSCGHRRLECSAELVGADQQSLQRGSLDNDLTTISIRDQGGGAPNLFTPTLGFFTVAELVELCPTGTPGVAAM